MGFIRLFYFGNRDSLFNRVYIGRNAVIKGGAKIHFGKDVVIRPYAQIWCGKESLIGNGTEIGERSRISTSNSLEIGQDVLISPNVYISDADHAYQDISVPVIMQGIVATDRKTSIGDGSYIGINTVVIGGICIGRHCVIGANSVVTSDVPDYSVVAGAPAKIIRQYDFEEKVWKRI
jgi:acetyltransferase-like isoleucine patch superfamily enzyme